jgi:hypothetical protein
MKKISIAVIIIISLFVAALAQSQACDKASAKKLLASMRPEMVSKVSTEDGWIVVVFGKDYFSWTDRQCEGIVTTYANADACLTGKARSLEFRSPSGKLIARADSFRGIKMHLK